MIKFDRFKKIAGCILESIISFKDPSKLTMNDRKQYIKFKLSTDDAWALRALNKIFERQTIDEQNSETTMHLNQMGFTGTDANFLTSIVKNLKKYGRLTPKQMSFVKRIMPKYWQQILEIADRPKLDSMILDWKLSQQPDLIPKTASIFDNERKERVKRHINNELFKITKGFFTDQYWQPVNAVRKYFETTDTRFELQESYYGHDEKGTPNSKTWIFKVFFINEKGKEVSLNGVMTASGAGSVGDPMDRYDMVAFVN